ncbi:FUSC family protein [Sinomicrobium kalidii]|uniref:FUSC family protein n=1 Tax=Sinomicrobium kalidii TaxID=2900738 RepID=UPI001E2BBAD8|nr:FUSC family protein [Sinomicrobium kalidii]UGU15417.1 FUSC family protein [Sinomicrobium kalidii]
MKKFTPYKAIRRRAMIMGLPIGYFAIQMISVIASLLVIIFSFNLGIIVALLVANFCLFVILTKLTRTPGLLRFRKVFPDMISNKLNSHLDYGP